MGLGKLSGLGALAGGFQQGVGFMQDVNEQKQLREARKYALNQMGRDDRAADEAGNFMTAQERREYAPEDLGLFEPTDDSEPFLYRLFGKHGKPKARRRRSAAPLASPTPTMEAPTIDVAAPADVSAETYPAEDQPEVEVRGFDDGGEVAAETEREAVLRRAAENRARTASAVSRAERAADFINDTTAPAEEMVGPRISALRRAGRATGDALGRAARFGAEPVKPAVGVVGRLGRGLGYGAATAGIEGAWQGYDTPTEDYARRFGFDPNHATDNPLKEVGIRGLGVLSDVGAKAINMGAGLLGSDYDYYKNFRDVQIHDAERKRALDRNAAREEVARETAAEEATPRPARPAGPPPTSRIPTPEGQHPEVDMAQYDIGPEDIPNVNIEDWQRVRANYLRQARIRGIPAAEALDQVDKLVTGMQQRGFVNYGQQAIAHMMNGNLPAAQRAVYAAYQYLPNGRDMRVGIQGDHLVAVGFDEKTGKQVGRPMALNPERLSVIVDNFSQGPEVVRHWTKDWRDELFHNKDYNERIKPLTQAQADYYTGRANAATGLGGAGGLKLSDLSRAEGAFRENQQLTSLTDPRAAETAQALMSVVKASNPSMPENVVIKRVNDFMTELMKQPPDVQQQLLQQALSPE